MGTLYENILSLCKEKGITGGKMCTDIGLSKSLMTGLKKGRRSGISVETAQKIADYFDISVDCVLGIERETEQEAKPKGSEKGDEFLKKYKKLSPEQQQIIDAMINQMYGKKDV